MAKRPKNKHSKKARLFTLFDKGLRPKDIGNYPGLKQKTIYQYFNLWQHKGSYQRLGIKDPEMRKLVRDIDDPLRKAEFTVLAMCAELIKANRKPTQP